MRDWAYLRRLGQRVKKLREAKKLTQEALGDVPPRTVQDIEAGLRDPRVLTLRRIAVALGCEVAELLPPAGPAGKKA